MHDVYSNAPYFSQGEDGQCRCGGLIRPRTCSLLHGHELSEVGREGGRDHRRRQRHGQGNRYGICQERRQGHPHGHPGRPRPRRRCRARAGRLLLPLRRDRRGPDRRRRRPRGGAPRPARHPAQPRRRRRADDHRLHRVPRSRGLRPHHGGQRALRRRRDQARGARDGAAPERLHHLHRQHGGGARRREPRVLHLQGRRDRRRARAGRGAGPARRARECHLAPRHRYAVRAAWAGGADPRGERGGAEADGGEGHGGRDGSGTHGRDGAAGGGHRAGGRVPGVRRVQVRKWTQPRCRRRVHRREADSHAGSGEELVSTE